MSIFTFWKKKEDKSGAYVPVPKKRGYWKDISDRVDKNLGWTELGFIDETGRILAGARTSNDVVWIAFPGDESTASSPTSKRPRRKRSAEHEAS